jgi:hypothetical protein
MKLFCEGVGVTYTLQVPTRVVEINPQKKLKNCTCTGTCRVRICFVCRIYNPARFSLMTYHQVFNKSNATGVEQELLTFPVVGGYQVLYYVHVSTFIL